MSLMKSYLPVLCLLSLMFSGCTLQSRLDNKFRRAERKIERLTLKYPRLLAKDTVRDTFMLAFPEIKGDTTFLISNDTVVLNKDRLTIQYIRVNDTIKLSGKCDADTIIRTVEVPVEKIVVRKQTLEERFGRFLKRGWFTLVAIVSLFLLGRAVLRFMNPIKRT